MEETDTELVEVVVADIRRAEFGWTADLQLSVLHNSSEHSEFAQYSESLPLIELEHMDILGEQLMLFVRIHKVGLVCVVTPQIFVVL